MQNDSTGPKKPSPEMGQPTSISHSVTSAYGSENTLEPFIDAQNSIVLVCATVSNIMFFIAGPPGWIVGIAVLAGILGATVPLFYSDDTAQGTWNPLSQYAAALMDSKITEAMIVLATAKTKELVGRTQTLKENLRAWLDSGKLTGRDLLRNSIFGLLNDYRPAMENLIQGTYRGILLPQYTQAALHFVTVLKSIYPYADELALNTRSVTSGREMILTELRAAIAKFVDQSIESYRYGLKQIIVRSENEEDEEENMTTWFEYNQYRNMMTQTALDIVVMFPYFDLDIYPNVPSAKWLNRKLYTLLDTSPGYPSPNLDPEDIAQFDAFVLTSSPVKFLEEIRHAFVSVVVGFPYGVDGLIHVQCTVRSIDGYDHIEKPEGGGATSENARYSTMPVKLREIYALNGWHWNKDARWNIFYAMGTTINHLTYHFIALGEKAESQQFNFMELGRYGGTSEFGMSFPNLQDALDPNKLADPSLFTERLAEIRIPQDRRPHYSYLCDWNHRSLRADMLPIHHHDPSTGIKYVEQYHAVKAAYSIFNQRLRIVPGPGFTGGDLVTVGAGQQLAFFMARDPKRWFSGNYMARIWYVFTPGSNTVTNVELSVASPDAAGSVLTGIIPYTLLPDDPDNLKFADLKCFDFFPGFIRIFPVMRTVELVFRNRSTASSINVDRIELIFDSVASH